STLSRGAQEAKLLPRGKLLFLGLPTCDGLCVAALGNIALAIDQGFDHAMREQVWVATYGRREMGIGGISQPEVPDIFGTVYGLLHRAQAHGLDEVGIGAACSLLQQLLVICRLGIVTPFEGEPQGFQECPQRLQLFYGGTLVDPVETGV